jgi:hypothetical protein
MLIGPNTGKNGAPADNSDFSHMSTDGLDIWCMHTHI